jgi:heme/copper-type cytochrome/quinol oxidase subunit 1
MAAILLLLLMSVLSSQIVMWVRPREFATATVNQPTRKEICARTY